MVYCETPTNPMMNLVDLAALGDLTQAHGYLFVVDNTFATPYLPASPGARRGHRAPLHHQVSQRPQRHGGRPAGDVARRPRGAARLHPERGRRGAGADGLLAGAARYQDPARSACGSTTPTAAGSRSGSPRGRTVTKVYYPGLPSHPQHELACRQMRGFGGMISIDARRSGTRPPGGRADPRSSPWPSRWGAWRA